MRKLNVSGHLLHNLILFGRVLRGLGLDVNTARVMDLAEALSYVDVGLRSDFYHAARTLLVHRREDLPLFDQAFEMFWQKPLDEWARIELVGRRVRRTDRKPLVVPAGSKRKESEGDEPLPEGEPRPVIEITRTYSAREALRRRDFSELDEDEVRAIERLMEQLIWQLGQRLTRRHRRGPGAGIDWRRTLRRSLRYGGDIIEWAREERKVKPRPLVVIADISGSMERYTRLLLHFIYCVTHGLGQRVEAFAVGTRLTRLSRHMQEKDVERALADVSDAVADWAGGTRIGESLKTFNYEWARRVLGGGAVVLLISDGWDRGDPELLGAEMALLRRSCYRLIWLNPLLGAPDYEPLTRGMQAALPHVDDFLPVHNLESLEALADHLARLDRRRGGRRHLPIAG